MKNKMTTFYIVRHGETEWNVSGNIQGSSDSLLTTKGVLQAENVGKKFEDIKFDLVISSDLLRAKRTAEIITKEINLEVQTTKLLRERHFGEFEGKHYTELRAFDEYFEALSDEMKHRHTSHGVESDENLTTRFITFFREVAITHPGKKVLVVAHGGIMRVMLRRFGFGTYQTLSHGAVSNSAWFRLESDGVDFFIKESHGITVNN